MASGNGPGLALQLYTVREDFARNPEDTVRRVADAGYTAVEVAGTGSMSAADFRELLDRYGLQAVGTHVSLNTMETNPQQEIENARTLGARYISNAYLPPNERQNPEELGRRLNAVGQRVREAGLTFSHHNHDFEFAQVDGERFIDRMLNAAEPDNLSLELDVYWAEYAGVDPLDYFRRYSGRIPLVHIKDMAPDRSFANVGEGTMDFKQITSAAAAQGTQWLIVENDQPGPNPVGAAATSLTNLKQMGIAR
ncbi:MAG TPA: sugar phosphate isomerase/epimerase [Chloroflexota bacterium]|nr:sugar phosphate isomerase/epimerase [Chloroflexota bacterium]